MIRILSALALLSLTTACSAEPTPNAATAAIAVKPASVSLTAADGVHVFGNYYKADHPKALILLFHQAGSSAAEYATIAPRLVDMGYSALAIDQRSGGGMFGANRTVKALGGTQSYMQAEQDLQAALDWAETTHQPIILWGSSYSAALVFLVAAQNPGAAKALLAFSPGEYLADKQAVETAAAKLDLPVFVTSTADATEQAAAHQIYQALGQRPAPSTLYTPQHGVHGSSTLLDSRNPDGAEQNWAAVTTFLKAVTQ
jgi:dienelactone hydrolase